MMEVVIGIAIGAVITAVGFGVWIYSTLREMFKGF